MSGRRTGASHRLLTDSTVMGFDYQQRADGSVLITHHGQKATVLRGARAEEFLEAVASDPQGMMARWTGNYKHGNERAAKEHPRNKR